MGPLAIILLGGAVYYIYEKEKNPAWSPFTQLLATPVDKVVALEKVKVTSVPTPSPTVALDPHMTTDQVKQVNQTLTSETDPKKIAAHAIALGSAGHENSAMALAAKANAVGEAKATGAHDVDIHLKQIEAAQMSPLDHVPVPIDAPMTACEAQVLLNVLTARQGHFDVEGVPVPLAITNAFDADTSHLIRIFQAEMHLPATGMMDTETAKALRIALVSTALGSGPSADHVPSHVTGWWDEYGQWHHRHHHHHHHYHPMVEEVVVPEVIEGVVQGVGWGPVAAGSSGPVATGFYGHPYGFHHFHPHLWADGYEGWTQPWQHGFPQGWAGWPWHHHRHHGWHGFVGQRGRELEHGRGRELEHGRGGRGREQFGRGREPFRGHERFGRGREQFGEYAPQPQYMDEEMGDEMMPMHHRRHRRHLTREQLMEQQERERERLRHMHHPHHRRHPREMMQPQMMQPEPAMDETMAAQEAAPPAGMPIGGGGGAAAMAAPLAVEPDHTADTAATATQGWWPEAGDEYSYFPQQGLYVTPRCEAAYYPPHEPSGGAAYWPFTPVGDFGGYGYIGEGGLGGLGGYGSWGSFGGWGHGL